MVPVPLCMEAKLKLEVFWKGLWWVCEVWSAELGAFIGWWCTVTLAFPFLITNSWKKSHESLRRAPPGNRTFPFPISESKQCLTDRYALRDPNKLARLVCFNLDRPGNVWELFHAKLSHSWRRRDTNSYGATRVSFKIFIVISDIWLPNFLLEVRGLKDWCDLLGFSNQELTCERFSLSLIVLYLYSLTMLLHTQGFQEKKWVLDQVSKNV